MGLFSRKKDGKSKKKGANDDDYDQQPARPQWSDAYARTSVEPEEVHELVKRCTEEIKNRGMSITSSTSALAKPASAASLRLGPPFFLDLHLPLYDQLCATILASFTG